VLENHHCAVLFAIMNGNTQSILHTSDHNPELARGNSLDGILVSDGSMEPSDATGASDQTNCDILACLDATNGRELRKSIIDVILATDMSSHFDLTKDIDTLVEKQDEARRNLETHPGHRLHHGDSTLFLNNLTRSDRALLMRAMLHCADISNPAKPWTIAKAWSDRVCEEFFAQGDLERAMSLPVTMNMDRHTTRQATLSLNFIDFIVTPIYVALTNLLPRLRVACELLTDGRALWEEMRAKESLDALTAQLSERQAEETADDFLQTKQTLEKKAAEDAETWKSRCEQYHMIFVKSQAQQLDALQNRNRRSEYEAGVLLNAGGGGNANNLAGGSRDHEKRRKSSVSMLEAFLVNTASATSSSREQDQDEGAQRLRESTSTSDSRPSSGASFDTSSVSSVASSVGSAGALGSNKGARGSSNDASPKLPKGRKSSTSSGPQLSTLREIREEDEEDANQDGSAQTQRGEDGSLAGRKPSLSSMSSMSRKTGLLLKGRSSTIQSAAGSLETDERGSLQTRRGRPSGLSGIRDSGRKSSGTRGAFNTLVEGNRDLLIIPERRASQAMSLGDNLRLSVSFTVMGTSGAGKSSGEVAAGSTEQSNPPSVIKYKLQIGRRYNIGRSRSNEICLEGDVSASRKHCYIDIDHRGRCVIQDLGATAGTFLNGSKVRRACLFLDDIIVCGKTTLQLYRKKKKRGMFNLLSLLAADSGNYHNGVASVAVNSNDAIL
jgi:hypothetical protein